MSQLLTERRLFILFLERQVARKLLLDYAAGEISSANPLEYGRHQESSQQALF